MSYNKVLREGIDPVRFRRMVAGDGCFARLPIMPNDTISEEDINNAYMWRTVIDRALLDLTGKELKERVEVIEWLDLRNNDFLLVCELALLKPENVYEQMWEIAEMLTNDGIPPQK